MSLTYIKRYRMEIFLHPWRLQPPELRPGYRLVPWSEGLIDAHADTKYRSFRGEIDANVFPCLGESIGCQRLMEDIASRLGFCPQATWLVEFTPAEGASEYCGTIQGVRDGRDTGGIQNLGVTPEHRGRGLGSILMAQSLWGFHQVGVRRVYLEVTAQNEGALRLYQRLGFRCTKTVYKAMEAVYST